MVSVLIRKVFVYSAIMVKVLFEFEVEVYSVA